MGTVGPKARKTTQTNGKRESKKARSPRIVISRASEHIANMMACGEISHCSIPARFSGNSNGVVHQFEPEVIATEEGRMCEREKGKGKTV